ncbi:glycosyltransferase [Paenibacillus sp. TRM 82003]|nr:glycosyltransferase [Paenibacillus sp. TRM 82003]
MWSVIGASIVCILWGLVFVRTALGMSAIRDLPSGLAPPGKLPLVSVIIAAKEEQESIQETIRHLHHQTYPKLEIIAVNDRSQDATGARMEALKAWSEGRPERRPSLRIIHITQLPSGWLGKNHAMYQGYLQAKGSYLLFTDADVRFEPHAIQDAVAYMAQQEAGHLTLLPKLEARAFWLRAFVHYFLFSICLLVPPWTGNNDAQRKYGLGVGAFNLLRRDVYEAIGTHRALSMRPDDDLRLGMLVKRNGWKQRVAVGRKRIVVEWYPSLRAAVRGLEKNLYSGFGYRVEKAALGVAGQVVLFALPLSSPLWARGPALLLWLLSAALLVGSYLLHIRRFTEEDGREAIALPITVWLLIGVLVRSVFLSHRRKGVYWRGTFYSLSELRRMFR